MLHNFQTIYLTSALHIGCGLHNRDILYSFVYHPMPSIVMVRQSNWPDHLKFESVYLGLVVEY